MALIKITNGYLSFGEFPLLDHIDLSLEKNQRLCLVGRNGAGKSSLLKVIKGEYILDDGLLEIDGKIAYLDQNPPISSLNVYDFVAQSFGELYRLMHDYHQLLSIIEKNPQDNSLLAKLESLQLEIERVDGWSLDHKITTVLTKLNLNPQDNMQNLSGGARRRSALAKALVLDPDILLLDEPTNHFDLASILWLEKFLIDANLAVIFISHDRDFISNVATGIIDLDRGKLKTYPAKYDQYLVQKMEDLRIEEEQNALFDKKLAQEEVWIRQGIKARRTRNEGRVRALKELREQRANRQTRLGKVDIAEQEISLSGKIIFDLERLNFTIDDKTLIKDLSMHILRGDKIALVGANGIGKTSLIKVLLGIYAPTSGKCHVGTKLEVAYFDQLRSDLDEEKTVLDNIADGTQDVEVNGVKRHALGYLQDFLFEPKRARQPVKSLSGGEKNRLLLAKLLLKPHNLLVLDEPTNDLDIETLELLEEKLSNFKGTIIIVSHDRRFIDNVATQCLFFEGDGVINQYIGGYNDALAQQQNYLNSVAKRNEVKPETIESKPEAKNRINNRVQKLSYNEKKELEQLPNLLAQIEAEIEQLQQLINSNDFFSQEPKYTQEKLLKLSQKEVELEQKFNRWEELEAKS